MVVYSGSLQRVDFSEEAEQKGFCLVELDPSAPLGQRMVDFQFRPVNARPFVTVDVRLTAGDDDPTDTVIRAIARKDIQDAVVRVRITLPAELEPHLRESDIRQALAEAHYIAAISQQTEDARRTRLGTEVTEGLLPMQALRLYLEGRSVEPKRQEKMLRYAEELAEMDVDTS